MNIINALSSTTLIPQRKEITATQLLRKARYILQIKENQTNKISELQSKIGKLQRDAYEKYQVIDFMIKDHFQYLKVKDTHKYQFIAYMIKEHFQDLEGKYAHIQPMAQLHATKLSSKDRELRNMANKVIADRKKSNIVSVFISYCLYNFGTCHSLPFPFHCRCHCKFPLPPPLPLAFPLLLTLTIYCLIPP